MLQGAGFAKLAESAEWALERGKSYFVTRNDSSVIAFSVGGAYEAGCGVSMIGCHTDSPCLKLKVESNAAKGAYLSLGVEVYGGPILHTWFDRDLGLAGRVVARTADGALATHKVLIRRPILRVPTLAIHLDRSVNESFTFNKESDLAPVFASAAKAALCNPAEPVRNGHPAMLLQLLGRELGVSADDIVDFDLVCFDVQPASLGGVAEEFIFAPRLDNLGMSFCATEALVASCASLATERNVRLIALFDNEEVGSETAHGANSSYLQRIVARVLQSLSPAEASVVDRAMARSFFISADMAHAVHPNQPGKHGATGAPLLNRGPVIKSNAQQRYATTAVSAAVLRDIGRTAGVPLQAFSARNDCPCGSTVGPMTSALLGVRTVDMGNPMLSMHSAREMCGVDDVALAIKLFCAFFDCFAALEAAMAPQ